MNLFQILHKIQTEEVLSQAERDFLVSLFLTKDGKLRFMQALESRWSDFETTRMDFDPETLLKKVRWQISAGKPKKTFSLPTYIRYSLEVAAAILIVFTASLFLQKSAHPGALQEVAAQMEVYNPKGLRTTIILPDSSKVTLNADTRISYAYNFEEATRIVKLEGEAFFDVHRDEERPFIVQANEATLVVLGTSFNVRAYPENNSVEATLVEGSLKVGVGKTENLLKPGQQINIRESTIIKKVHNVDVRPVMAWMDGNLHVQSMSFAELAMVLERTFNVNIYIRNDQLKQKRFTGKFENGENLDRIFQVMQASVPFNLSYDKESNTLIIR